MSELNDKILNTDLLSIVNGVNSLLTTTKDLDKRVKDLEIIIKGNIIENKPSLYQSVKKLEEKFEHISTYIQEDMFTEIENIKDVMGDLKGTEIPDINDKVTKELSDIEDLTNRFNKAETLLLEIHKAMKPFLWIGKKFPKFLAWLSPIILAVIGLLGYFRYG
jgi:hypothetical protein